MPVSIYETRTMLAALSFMPPMPTLLWDMFVKPNAEYSHTDLVEVDYQRGSTRMAPFVDSEVGGIVMDRSGFQSAMFRFPCIAPERVIKVSDLQNRQMGENVYTPKTAEDREQALIAKDLMELRTAIAIRKNWMVAQLLFNTPGKLSLDVMGDKGLIRNALKVDFGFRNEVVIAIPWSNAAADPLADIEAITDSARDSGGTNPNIIIMGAGAARAYRQNPNTQKQLDIRNIQAGLLQAAYAGDYLKYMGTSPNGLEMYSYTGTYVDDDGKSKLMVPDGKVAVLPKELIRSFFGPVLQLEPGDIRHTEYLDAQEVPLYLPDYKKNTTGLRLTSKPMIAPENIDNWAVADAL